MANTINYGLSMEFSRNSSLLMHLRFVFSRHTGCCNGSFRIFISWQMFLAYLSGGAAISFTIFFFFFISFLSMYFCCVEITVKFFKCQQCGEYVCAECRNVQFEWMVFFFLVSFGCLKWQFVDGFPYDSVELRWFHWKLRRGKGPMTDELTVSHCFVSLDILDINNQPNDISLCLVFREN